jgi:type IV pilus assembly protein PilX
MNRHVKRALGARLPQRERGTMLIIALIVLVAMTLAGIAAMRSVDTAAMMAGNLALRQSTLNAADQGIQAGYAVLNTPSTNPLADPTIDAMNIGVAGYYSNAATLEPNWADAAAWNNRGVQLNGGAPDAAGNVVMFIVERLCTLRNTAAGATGQQCSSTITTSQASPAGQDNFRPQDANFASQSQPNYRITARAAGPRNSVAVVQAMLR